MVQNWSGAVPGQPCGHSEFHRKYTRPSELTIERPYYVSREFTGGAEKLDVSTPEIRFTERLAQTRNSRGENREEARIPYELEVS